MKHLQQGIEKRTDTTTNTITTPSMKTEQMLPKSMSPCDPTARKPHKQKDEENCTTIGLQIQIHDPVNEPTPTATSFQSDATSYPFSQEVIGAAAMPQNVISNSMMQLSPITAPSMNTVTYYNLDSSGTDNIIEYDPDPVTFQSQPASMMTSECVSLPNPMHSNVIPPHHPYDIQLLNYANNSVVCDNVHNWRAINGIMLNK